MAGRSVATVALAVLALASIVDLGVAQMQQPFECHNEQFFRCIEPNPVRMDTADDCCDAGFLSFFELGTETCTPCPDNGICHVSSGCSDGPFNQSQARTRQDCCNNGGTSFQTSDGGRCVECFQGCFAEFGCSGDTIALTASSPPEQVRECCLQTSGLSYNFVDQCVDCVAFGFLETTVSGIERGPGYTIEVGYIKRPPSVSQVLRGNVQATGTGSATNGEDFSLNSMIYTARPNNPGEILVRFLVDNVAQEQVETAELQLDILANIQRPPNLILRDTLTLEIVDSDIVVFQFTENDYRSPENAGRINAVISKTLRIANPVTFQVFPYTVQQAEDLGLLINNTELNVPANNNRFSPNRAQIDRTDRPPDFINTTLTVTFEADEDSTIPVNDMPVPVNISNDDIDEAQEEVFIINMQLESATNPDGLQIDRASSLCRINDDDVIQIGFQNDSYTFPEPDSLQDHTIFLEKQDGVRTEQTYVIIIQASQATPGPGIGNAEPFDGVNDNDYTIGLGNPSDTVTPEFSPDEQLLPFGFFLFADLIAEGQEAFQVSSNSDERPEVPAFSTPDPGVLYPTAFINIADNDRIRVGFEQNFTVPEDIGTFEVCFGVIFPPSNVSITANIDLVIDTMQGTAGEMDYTPINSSRLDVLRTLNDGTRRACFDVTINADNIYEDTEEFSLVLDLDPFVPESVRDVVTIDPSVIYVQIEDTTPLTIGFINPPYTSEESSLVSSFQVGVIGGTVLTQEVTVDFSTANGASGGGRDALDGLDYESRTTSLTFGPDVSQLEVNVTLIDDGVFELTESFLGILSVPAPVDRLTLDPAQAVAEIVDDDLLTVGYAQLVYQFDEESGENAVGLVFTGDAGFFELNVNYQTLELGSGERDAQGDIDYESSNDTITISATGANSHPVVILPDDLAEYTESFGLELFDAFITLSGNQLTLTPEEAARITIDPEMATVEILSDDVARIGFVQTLYEASEADGFVNFGIGVLEGSLSVSVDFSFSTADGTALNGSDYIGGVRDITFSSSVMDADVAVDVINDTVYENTETFFGQLSGSLPPFVTLDPAMATAQINDDDEVVIGFRIVSDPMDVNEDAGPAIFDVAVLEGTISEGIEFLVTFFTRDGTAIADDDYIFLAQNLTFSSTSLDQQVSVTINNDPIFEDFETFTGNLRLVGTPERVTVAPDVANARIVDEDTLRIGFLETDYQVVEGPGRSVSLRVGVLEGQLGRNIGVVFNTQDGTALAGPDYMAVLNEQLQFVPILSESFSIVVGIVNDNAVEPIEYFQGLLVDPVIDRLTVDPGVANVTITDNDTAVIGFDRAVYNVIENEMFSNVTIRLTGVINTAVTVRLTTADGSAVSIGPEADFVSHDMEYTFVPGGPTEITVPIRILDDLRLENDEGLDTLISLTTTSTAILLDPADAMIMIFDDDNVVVGFDQTLYSVTEGPGAVANLVVRVINGELRRDVVVNFRTVEGTALETQDYSFTTQTLTFNQGTTSITIPVPITDDNINEALERFIGVLTTTDGDVILSPNVTVVEITDDDPVFVSYRLPVYMFSEGMGVGLVCVDKIGATTQTITVIASGPLHDAGGAVGMEVLTFAPEETEQCFNYTIVDDDIALEMTQVLTWGLAIDGQPPLVQLGDNPTTDILIIDDDILTITVNKNDRVIESGESIETCLIFSNPFAQEFSLDRATQLPPNASLPDDGTRAEAGTDFEPIDDTLTIRPEDGDNGQLCFNTTIIDDQIVEDPLECFGVTLSIPESEELRDTITLNGGSLVCCIEDDDTVDIGFDPVVYNVHEGEGSVTLRVRVLNGELARAIDAVVTTRDGSATSTAPVDYINPGTITVQFDSQQLEQTVIIQIENDDIFENEENFFGNVESFDQAVQVTVPEAEVFIREDPDNNDRPTIGFVPDVYSVSETDGTVTLNVEIIRGTLERDVEVVFNTLSGTATQEAPEDYLGITRMVLLFTPTVSMVMVPVDIVNDAIVEADETFTGNLGLDNPDDAFLVPDVATVTILGEDPNDRVVIGLEQDYTVEEGQTVEVCAVLRSGTLEREAQVTLSSASGTAIDGVDYETLLATLVFSPSVNRACANLIALIDGIVEGDETLSVNLDTTDGQVDLDPETATVTITDVDRVVIGLQETVYSVDEDEGSLEVCAEIISGQLARNLDVTLTSADGTAIAPGDYGSVAQTLTFMDTDDVVCVNITIIPDSFYEFDETFTVTLATQDAQATVQPDREVATVTILDDDELVIGFDPDVYNVAEDGGSIQLCARILNGDLALEREVIVNASTSMADPLIYDNPATAGDDYEQTAVTLVFNRDNTERCFTVTINQDDVTEGTEVFIANIVTDAPRVTLNPDTAVVSILDADAVVIGYRDQPYVFQEDGGVATVRVVVVNGVLSDELVVNIQTLDIPGVNNAAIGGVDYVPVDMDLTFGPMVTSISVNITLNDDGRFELDEIFNTNLTIVTQGIRVDIENNQPLAVVEILDDDTITVEIEVPEITEPEDVGVRMVCAVVTDGMLDRAGVVTISTAPGTALANEDYVPFNVDLTFDPDILRACFNVTIVDDNRHELNETFDIVITTTDTRIELPEPNVPFTIVDDDEVVIGFERIEYNVTEASGMVEVCVVIQSGELTFELPAINLVTRDGSAVAVEDYDATPNPSSVVFSDTSATRQCAIITITEDSDYEELIESFFVDLETMVTERVTIDPMTTQVNIIDEDVATIGFAEVDVSVSEGAGTATLNVVVISGVVRDTVAISYSTTDNTASSVNNLDYTSTSGQLTFNVGTTQNSFQVPISEDTLDEIDETFLSNLVLVTDTDRITVSPAEATVTILDNDVVVIGLEQVVYVTGEDMTIEVCARVQDDSPAQLDREVTVRISTSDGSAEAPDDYAALVMDLLFTPTRTRVCVNITTAEDEIVEGEETFNVTLTTDDDNVTLNPDEAIVIIEEDDVVRVTFTQPIYVFTENGVTGSVMVLKTADTDEPFQVRVQGGPSIQTDVEISAAGIDEVITFEAGPDAPDTITVTFALTDDSVALEAIETYTATLTILADPVGVELGMFPTTDILVNDDDVVTVEFGRPTVTVSEEDEQFTMCVTLDRRTLQDVTVMIRSDDGTATAGSDYDAASIPTSVTVSAGDDRTCFNGTILNDLIPEPTESFMLTITSTNPTDRVTIGSVNVTEIFIEDIDSATVRFERPEYTFSEDVGTGEVCLIKDAETVSDITVQVTTAPGSATAGADYDAGPYEVTFGTAANDRQCISVGIITDAETEDPETFTATIVTAPGSGATPGDPSTAVITITDTGVQVNDTAIGDPLMTVPLLVSEGDLAALNTSQISLCYEIHGTEDEYFNLVTDECASVNAHYVDLTERLNVIGQIAVRATDDNDRCRNILVDVGECSAEVDGVALPVNGRFMEGGISVRRYANRVRISVPNCNELSLVMWVFCEARTLDDPEVPNGVIEGRMIKYVVMRGLNFGHRMAHGLIGQFWNIPARITPFTGLDRNGDPQPNRYIVNITGAQSGEPRAFTGWYYPLTWEFEEGPCLYVGNLQGGPIYEVTNPNDPVIEGTYADYMVQSAFSEEAYDFGLFNEDRCTTGSTETPMY